MTPVIISNAGTGGAMFGISVSSKNPVRCVKVLELANTDPAFANIITFGIEGKHYKKVGADHVKRIPNSGYAPFVWETCNQYIQYLQESEKDDKWTKMAEFDKTGKPSPTLGFRFNKDAMSIEITALDNVSNQFATALINGKLDPAEVLPEWASQAKEAGGDIVLKEVQSQYNTWKKAAKK